MTAPATGSKKQEANKPNSASTQHTLSDNDATLASDHQDQEIQDKGKDPEEPVQAAQEHDSDSVLLTGVCSYPPASNDKS